MKKKLVPGCLVAVALLVALVWQMGAPLRKAGEIARSLTPGLPVAQLLTQAGDWALAHAAVESPDGPSTVTIIRNRAGGYRIDDKALAQPEEVAALLGEGAKSLTFYYIVVPRRVELTVNLEAGKVKSVGEPRMAD